MTIVGTQTRPCGVKVDLDPITEGRMWAAEVEGSDTQYLGKTAREAVEQMVEDGTDGLEIDWAAVDALDAAAGADQCG